MSSLADHITINNSYARSTNLERDAGTDAALNGYVLTGRVLEMVERITAALNNGTGGAWSVTGPYGSGKSSLGVFLAELFATQHADTPQSAHQLIADVDLRLGDRSVAVRERFDNRAFIDGLVTARSEPITHTITRALHRATLARLRQDSPAARAFPEIRLLEAALADIDSDRPTSHRPVAGLTARRRHCTRTAGTAPARRR